MAGEDAHDREALKALVRGLRPDLDVQMTSLKKPLTLMKGVRPENARSRNTAIVAAIRAANVRMPVRATLLHEDADEVEPAHLRLIARKESGVDSAPGDVLAVVPAWEIETWWLQFPEAVKAVRPSWRLPDRYVGRDVGRVAHAKEVLVALLRPVGRHVRVPDYTEADSPEVARQVVGMGVLQHPQATSDSWAVFVGKVKSI